MKIETNTAIKVLYDELENRLKDENPFFNEEIENKWDLLYDIIRSSLKDNDFDTFDCIETATSMLVDAVRFQAFQAGISFVKQLLK